MFERARNLKDLALQPAAFALPAAASASTQSAAVNLNGDPFVPERIELELVVPALTTVIVPDTKTVNYIIETSTVANFAAIAETILNDQVAGAAGAGVAAYRARVRPPSNCATFVRARIAFGANTTTGAAVSAQLNILF